MPLRFLNTLIIHHTERIIQDLFEKLKIE